MRKLLLVSSIFLALFSIVSCSAAPTPPPDGSMGPIVRLETNQGVIRVQLYPDAAPVTVKNFLAYVEAGQYDGTIFHRVIKNFMIQGGGFNADMVEKPTQPPIVNEAGNGLKNDRGTIAMARTAIVNSATAQFYINLKSNDFLNHRDDTQGGFGYAVFGKVIEGMDVVYAIGRTQTEKQGNMSDVPVQPIVIIKATVE